MGLLAVMLIIFSGCHPTQKVTDNEMPKKVVVEGSRPEWITQRPNNPNYYTGIAVSSKVASPTNYALEAQRNALLQLASSIEVDVKSNSMLFTFEEKTHVRDEFKEFIQVKANQNIENYELVSSWESPSEYWVYYRLSKEQYKKDKTAKIEKAVNLSVSLIEQAESLWVDGQYKEGFLMMFDALKPIKPYLGEPLPTTINGSKEVFLGNYLLSQITQASREFVIKSNYPEVETVWGGEVPRSELTFLVTVRDNQPIAFVPVRFEYSEGVIRPRDGKSSKNGESSTEIMKITSKKSLQKVNAFVDFESLILSGKRADEIDERIIEAISGEMSVVSIEVSAPKLFIQSTEKAFGNKVASQLNRAFEQKAQSLGFLVTSRMSDADLLVEIEANTKDIGVSYDLNNVLLNATITIVNAKGIQVYTDRLENLKGVSDSSKKASVQAYNKAIEDIERKVVPRFYRKYIH